MVRAAPSQEEHIWRKSIPGRINSQYKGPGVEMDVVWVQRWPVWWSLECGKLRAGRWKEKARQSH